MSLFAFDFDRLSAALDATSMQAAGGAPQTYIVAQNPLVLAHLLRENQTRSIDPQAYTTPASVFNTVSVDFAQTLPENELPKLINPKPDEIIDIPLQTAPIPAASLHKLDPVVPEDETLTVVVGAKGSCDNLCQNAPVSPRADITSPCRSEADITDTYPSRVRSLERNPRGSLSERTPIRMGSLERNARGSLSHRGSPIPIPPFTRQHSVPASPPPRTRRDQDIGQFSVQGSLNAQLAASVMNKIRQQPDPPLVEEIYDFGGENVKSCAAIAAQRAMKPAYRQVASSMAASHPIPYNVPVGVVQGVQFGQGPKHGHISKSAHFKSPLQAYPAQVPPSFAQPMSAAPPISYPQQAYSSNAAPGPQAALFKPQAPIPQASRSASPPFAQNRPPFASAASTDAQSIYASRQECSPVLPATQPSQVIRACGKFLMHTHACYWRIVFEILCGLCRY